MFARIFMFVLFRLYMYDMDNVYVCIVLTKWSNKNKFFFFFFFFCMLTSLRGHSFNSEYHTIVQLINGKLLLDSRVDRYLSPLMRSFVQPSRVPGPTRRGDSHSARSTNLLGLMLTWRTKRLRRPCQLAFVTRHSHSHTSCDICKCSHGRCHSATAAKTPFR